jgi:hypothetical protein
MAAANPAGSLALWSWLAAVKITRISAFKTANQPLMQ